MARSKAATFACEPTTGMDLGQSESGASMRRSEAECRELMGTDRNRLKMQKIEAADNYPWKFRLSSLQLKLVYLRLRICFFLCSRKQAC